VLDAFGLGPVSVWAWYRINLTVPATADLDMYLFDFVGDDAQDSDSPPWSSTNFGLGVPESITFTAATTENPVLVVTNADGGSGNYTVNTTALLCVGIAALPDDIPVTCPTPSPPNDFGIYGSLFDHIAVGIRPPEGADYDLDVYEDTTMTTFVEDATLNPVNVVALNQSDWASFDLGVQVSVASGTGDYQIEMENSFMPRHAVTDTFSGFMETYPGGVEVIDTFMLDGATVGTGYLLVLTVPPTADLDMYLFDFVGDNAQDSDSPPWSSTSDGPGTDESITFDATITGYYMLVVTNRDGGIGSYTVDGTELAGDVLTVSGTPVTSGNLPPGRTNVLMERLILSADSGMITVTDITLDQTGSGTDSDTGNVYLYDDTNDNGILDIGTDPLLGTQTFAGGSLTFTGLSIDVVSPVPERLLIVFDIAVGATLGNTLQFSLATNAYVICAPDTTSALNFPIDSNTVTVSSVTTGNIVGTVVDEIAVGIDNASVGLYDSSGTLLDTNATDADGTFLFTDVDAGTGYFIMILANGYKGYMKSGIDVVAGTDTDLGNIELATDGEIKGKVLKPDGSDFPGVTVELRDDGGVTLSTTTTGADGMYKFEGLPYGEYSVHFSTEGYEDATIGSLTIDSDHLEIVNGDHTMTLTGGIPGNGGFLDDWWWLLVLIIVLVVILLVVFLLLFKRRKKPTEIPPEPAGAPEHEPSWQQAEPAQPVSEYPPPLTPEE
jgi:hypothetical protein